MMVKAFVNWSGGKDCTLALHKVLEQRKLSIEFLFTSLSRQYQRVSMHGVRKELVTRQALSIGIKSRKLYLPEDVNEDVYDKYIRNEMLLMKERGITNSVFGDIFLEDLRKYREERSEELQIKTHFPLWKKSSIELLKEFIDLGYKSIIVSIDKQKLNENFLGKVLTHDLINELPVNVDPCGENGEFHTFVYNGPLFTHPVEFVKGEKAIKSYEHAGKKFEYAFLDITVGS